VPNLGLNTRNHAFTILELLAVIAVISILAALMVPAINSIGGSQNLEGAGRLVADQWNLARQEAITRNRQIEFRLYKFQDNQESGDAVSIRGLQLFEIDAQGRTNAISRPTFLPPGTQISESSTLTSLASLPETTALATDPPISRAGSGYTYRRIQISPDGRPVLSSGSKHFLTLVPSRDLSPNPKNYVLISISPMNGRLQTFRP